jgi:glutamyl-tRNA reductase
MIQLTTIANARVLIVGEGRLIDEIVRNLTAHGRHAPQTLD